MSLNFPLSPSDGQIYTFGTSSFVWSSVKNAWLKLKASVDSTLKVSVSPDYPPSITTTSEGEIWYNSSVGHVYIHIEDKWVQINEPNNTKANYLNTSVPKPTFPEEPPAPPEPIYPPEDSFISIWKVPVGEGVVLPCLEADVSNCRINWGDGHYTEIEESPLDLEQLTHVYSTSPDNDSRAADLRTITIEIEGDGYWDGFRFGETTDYDSTQLISIKQFGRLRLHKRTYDENYLGFHFAGCSNLTEILGVPQNDPTIFKSMVRCFSQCTSLVSTPNLEEWDVSGVESFESCFNFCLIFNQPLSEWDVSNAKSFEGMFTKCETFNQDLSSWRFSTDPNVDIDFTSMFGYCLSYNNAGVSLNSWNTTRVTDMSFMFRNARAFNQPIGAWDVSNVQNMRGMFTSARAFNQPIGDWDVSNVVSMTSMFSFAQAFNQPIGNWNVSKVQGMGDMFEYAWDFNQPIGDWDVSNVVGMAGMFKLARKFNKPIGNWNVSNVQNMRNMFDAAWDFNQPIGGWDVSNVQDMSAMFRSTLVFNQSLSGWNTSNVQRVTEMFNNARAFNQPLGHFDFRNLDYTLIQGISGQDVIVPLFLYFLREARDMSPANYDSLLVNLANTTFLKSTPDIYKGLTGSPNGYTVAGVSARNTLINNGWVIYDGGYVG